MSDIEYNDDWVPDQQIDSECVERWLDAFRIDSIHTTWEQDLEDEN